MRAPIRRTENSRRLKASKRRLRVVNRTRFVLSMAILLMFVISTGMMAYGSLDKAEGASSGFAQDGGAVLRAAQESAQQTTQHTTSVLEYTVQSGDTLWSIASRTNKTHFNGKKDIRELVYGIQQANGLKGSMIFSGQVLEIHL